MDEVKSAVQSPSWWALTIFVGLLLNVVSAYLKAPIDRALSAVSTWWDERRTRSDAQFAADVDRLASAPDELEAVKVKFQSDYFAALMCAALGVACVVFSVLYAVMVDLPTVDTTKKARDLTDGEWFFGWWIGAAGAFWLFALDFAGKGADSARRVRLALRVRARGPVA